MRDFDLAHKAFDRMKRAHERGTGCHLTAEMIFALSVTFLGQVWAEDAPATPADTALSPASKEER